VAFRGGPHSENIGCVTTDYSQAWLEYRKKRNQVLLVLIGYFPLALLFFAIPVSMFNLGFGFLNFCWLAVLAFVILRLRAWRCPRCGDQFFAHSGRSSFSFFAKNCGNCQLRKYST